MTRKLYTSATHRYRGGLKVSASFLKFLQDTADNCLISALLLRGCVRMGRYVAINKEGKKAMDFISYRDAKGLISFMPPNRAQLINADGRWAKEGRQTMKPAKFARDILNPRLLKRIKEHEFANFASKFKASEIENEVTFHIVSVKDGYTLPYSEHIGSCMQGKNVHKFYDMYDCNVLQARRNGKNVGRAILWNNISINGEVCQFMDRIYARTNEVIELFKSWALDNGAYRKYNQNGYNDECLVKPDGSVLADPTIFIKKINKPSTKVFIPYLDTLEYTDKNYNCLSNRFRFKNGMYWVLKSSENYRECQSHMVNAILDDKIEICNKSQCIKHKGVYYYRTDRNIVECSDHYKYYHKDDKKLFKYNNRYYLKERRVVIGDVLYFKTDPRIEKCKNNRWVLKPAPVIEKVKEPETVETGISTGMQGVLQKWTEDLNAKIMRNQWTNPAPSFFNYDILTYGDGPAILTSTENQ